MDGPGARLRKTLDAGGLLVLLILIVYAPVLNGGFVWDDDTHVTANLIVERGGLWRSWLTAGQHNYWPVTWTATWVQWKLWGAHPTGYHIVTVLLHAACAVLTWRVLRHLAIPGAWVAALVFGIHPVNVETGAWITQQKNLWCWLFALVSVLLYVRSLKSETRALYAWSIAAFVVSLLSKTATVTLPVALVGCGWWLRRKLTWADVRRTIPFFALTVVFSVVEIFFQYTRAQAADVRMDSLAVRFAGAGPVVLFYLRTLFHPADLCFIYANPRVDPGALLTYAPHVFFAAVLLAALWKHDGWGRPVLFGLVYYGVMLSPVVGFLNIYFMRYSYMADHWQYMATIGPIALVTGALAHATRSVSPPARRLIGVLAAAVVVLLGVQGFQRAAVFRDSETLWRDTLAKNPDSWMARNNWGMELAAQGRMDEAVEQLERAVALKPDSVPAHLNLARALAGQGRLENALAHADLAAQLEPENPDPHYERGRLLLALERPEEAAAGFEAALQRRPSLADAEVGLGVIAHRLGRYAEAVRRYEAALRLDTDNATARENLDKARQAVEGKQDD